MAGRLPFRKTFTLRGDFGVTADFTVTAAAWVEVGTFTCEAGVKYELGYPVDSYAGASFFDDTATPIAEPGVIRVIAADPRRYNQYEVLQFHTDRIGSQTDKDQMIALPPTGVRITEDSHFILEFMSDATDIVTYDDAGTWLMIDASAIPV